MAFFRSAILALAITSAVFAQNVANPLSMYNPAMNPATMNPASMMNPMMNSQMMGGYPYMGQQQQSMLGMNPYQSMMGMPGSMMGMNPQMNPMMVGGFPQMPGQSMFGMNPYQSMMGFPQQAGLGLNGMPGSMMGMPGMQGYGNPLMNNPMMMSPYSGMPGLTQSPYGLPMGGQQQSMLGMNPYQSLMGLQSGGRLNAPVYGRK